jgi:site-specific DNA-methyltransferase (adenine-specific)
LGNTTYEQKYTNYPTEILEINIENGHIHPTQKPVALMEYLIATYSNEGHTVLDNCMGSGTTGVACKKMGRKFIGIEISEEYYNIAQERINTTPTSNNQFF